MVKAADRFERRARRARYALKENGKGRLRLSVFRSGRHIYGQVIDDEQGRDPGRRVEPGQGRCAPS